MNGKHQVSKLSFFYYFDKMYKLYSLDNLYLLWRMKVLVQNFKVTICTLSTKPLILRTEELLLVP